MHPYSVFVFSLMFGYGLLALRLFKEYEFNFDRVVTEYVNNDRVYNFKIRGIMLNRTKRAFNACFGTVYGIPKNGLKIFINPYYIKDNMEKCVAQEFNMDVCPLMGNAFMTKKMFKDSNITSCPMAKGYYCLNNFVPPAELLPPGTPQSKYMIYVKLFNQDEVDLLRLKLYCEVKLKV